MLVEYLNTDRYDFTPVSVANPLPVTGGGTPPAASYGATPALASNLVLKNSPGTLYSFEVSADSTLSAAAWWVMIFDATSAPADGAVTPAKVYAVASGGTQTGGTFDAGGVAFLTGITIVVSTTGPFTKTASAHAFIGGDFI